MSFLDMDERLLELGQRADLVYSPLVDRKDYPDGVDVCLVEGAVSSEDDLAKIRMIRERTRILVSFGDCAVTSNVPGMRNPIGPLPLLERAYLENATDNPQLPSQVVPELLPAVAARPPGRQGRPVPARLPTLGRPHLPHPQRAAGGAHAGHRAHRPLRRLTRRPRPWPARSSSTP